jgi:hypothetical protein
LTKATQDKKRTMRKTDGFGIDTHGKRLILDINLVDRFSLWSPNLDPIYEAANLLINWFLKINSDLKRDQELKQVLKGKKLQVT